MESMHEARTWRRSLCRGEKTWKLLAKGCEETFGFICLFVYFYHRWNFLMGKQVYGVGITPWWARERTGILTWASLLHNLVLYLPVLWTTLPISENSGDILVSKGNPASEGHCLQSKHSWLEAKTKHMFPEDWSLKHFRSAWSLKATSHPSELDLKTHWTGPWHLPPRSALYSTCHRCKAGSMLWNIHWCHLSPYGDSHTSPYLTHSSHFLSTPDSTLD